MDRQIAGVGSAEYLWTQKRIVPFLKVDKGLEAESQGDVALAFAEALQERFCRPDRFF